MLGTMRRSARSRAALLLGAIALLGGAFVGSRALSDVPNPDGVTDDVVEVEKKLTSSSGASSDNTDDADPAPYQPPVQAVEPSEEAPREAPGHAPIPNPDWDETAGDQEDEDD